MSRQATQSAEAAHRSYLGETIPVLVTPEARKWFETLTGSGLFQVNSAGEVSFEPRCQELVRAMHTVLSGGDVRVERLEIGDPAMRKDLDDKFDAAMASTKTLEMEVTPYTP